MIEQATTMKEQEDFRPAENSTKGKRGEQTEGNTPAGRQGSWGSAGEVYTGRIWANALKLSPGSGGSKTEPEIHWAEKRSGEKQKPELEQKPVTMTVKFK
jgi:hypothetical protein